MLTHFLQAIVSPTAVLMLFVLLYAFSVHVYPTRDGSRTWVLTGWGILWIILGILALLAWLFIVF